MRAEVSYRGFDASPVSGRAQGIAVYQNGVRINEAFGDTVQWDVIPSIAVSSMSVVSNNPSFGLNALGGAISIQMKDGFSYQGGEIDVMGGSFGRRQIGAQLGASSGNAGIYVAAEGIKDDGFRNFSESEVKRFYGDFGLRGSLAEVHFSLTAAQNEFGATAAAPIQLLDRDWSNTFTSPQTTNLEVFMPTISVTVKATNSLTLSGVGYYRRYKNRVVDGNITEIEACGAGPNGASSVLRKTASRSASQTSTATISAQEPSMIRWVPSNVSTPIAGAGAVSSRDRKSRRCSTARICSSQAFPTITDARITAHRASSGPSGRFVVDGSGIIVGGPDELAPRNLDSENTYWGLYFSNALDVTDRLTVTVGGRYNHATIKLQDNTGDFPDLNATNKYERFNPQAGANYKLMPGLSIYGGYSESNRAPTPAELGCAEPEFPCLIESFLTDDPPLDQVVGRTAELGLRGQGGYYGGRYTWGAGSSARWPRTTSCPSRTTPAASSS